MQEQEMTTKYRGWKISRISDYLEFFWKRFLYADHYTIDIVGLLGSLIVSYTTYGPPFNTQDGWFFVGSSYVLHNRSIILKQINYLMTGCFFWLTFLQDLVLLASSCCCFLSMCVYIPFDLFVLFYVVWYLFKDILCFDVHPVPPKSHPDKDHLQLPADALTKPRGAACGATALTPFGQWTIHWVYVFHGEKPTTNG